MMQKRSALRNAMLLAAGLLLPWCAGAAAEQQETAALACKSLDQVPMYVSFVINFTAGTVQQDMVPYPVNITSVTEQKVEFTGKHSANGIDFYFHGDIDRVSGLAGVISVLSDQKTGKQISSNLHALQCRATKRVF